MPVINPMNEKQKLSKILLIDSCSSANLPEKRRTIPVKRKNASFLELKIYHFPDHIFDLSYLICIYSKRYNKLEITTYKIA